MQSSRRFRAPGWIIDAGQAMHMFGEDAGMVAPAGEIRAPGNAWQTGVEFGSPRFCSQQRGRRANKVSASACSNWVGVGGLSKWCSSSSADTGSISLHGFRMENSSVSVASGSFQAAAAVAALRLVRFGNRDGEQVCSSQPRTVEGEMRWAFGEWEA